MLSKLSKVAGTVRATRTQHDITFRVALDDEVTLDLEVALESEEFGKLLVDEHYEAECTIDGTVEAEDPDPDVDVE